MIANARMYAVAPAAAALWRTLLTQIGRQAGIPLSVIEHAAPQPLEALWARDDLAAAFMCGLPFSRALPQPQLIAAPVPAPPAFHSRAEYWSDLVVRGDSGHQRIEDTFGARLALTVPGSQSGCVAVLSHLMHAGGDGPLFAEVIAPTITPLGALEAVIQGAADLAPIDAYAFALLQRYRPDLTAQVRRIDRTPATPIPPLVATLPEFEAVRGAFPLRSAFMEAQARPENAALLAGLLLEGFVAPQPAAYAVLRERFETATRYWTMRPLAARIHPAFVLCDHASCR